jgi:hypothetical protein
LQGRCSKKEGRCRREGRSFVPGGILGFRDHMFARKVQQKRGKMQEGREIICARRHFRV